MHACARLWIPCICLPGLALGAWLDFGSGTMRQLSVDLLDASAQGVVFEVRISGVEVEPRTVRGTTYSRLRLPSGGLTADLGLPEVPSVARFIAIPQGASIEFSFTPLDSTEIRPLLVWPAQPPSPDETSQAEFVRDEGFYGGDTWFPLRPAVASEVGIIRGCRVALVGLFPFRYQPATQTLKVYTWCRVEVRFKGGEGVFVEPRKRSAWFEPALRRILLNGQVLGDPPALPRVREGEGEFLIISADALVSAVAPLAQWRTREGISTVVVSRTAAGSTAEGIGQFIRTAYTTWETPPSFVLLVGDAEHLPTNYRYQHPVQLNMTAADLWYFTVDGTDFFADIHYGRISVDNVSQLNYILDKILSYEKNPLPGAWNTRAFLASYEEPGMYFTITSNAIYSYLTSIGYSVNRAYEGGDPPGTTQDVIDNFNAGCFLINHRDHGGRENWVHPSFWVYDFNQVQNGQMLPLVFSINCLSGYFDAETDGTAGTFESFSEQLLRKYPGGTVAILSSSRTSYSGYNDELDKGLVDAIWPGFDPAYPSAVTQNPWVPPLSRPGAMLNYAKWFMYDKYVLTGGAGYPWEPTAQQTRLQMEMYHCHGDPTLDIHTAAPTPLVVSHAPTVPATVQSIAVSADAEGALVGISQNDVLLGRALVTGGVAVVPLSIPPVIGTLHVVVSAHNRIPHESTIQVTAPNGWYISLASVAPADVGGHVDGAVEQGDSVSLTISLSNGGTLPAPSVGATLTSQDPRVQVLRAQSSFGTIPPGGTASSDSFLVHIQGGTPDGAVLAFSLAITSAESSWVRGFTLQVHAPLMACGQVIIDDTAGNGNGRAEPGETVNLWVHLLNEGSGTATGPRGTLSCAGPGATVLVANATYPDVGPGQTVAPWSPYRVAVAPTCPVGTLPFLLAVSYGGPGQVQLSFSIPVGLVTVLVVDSDEEPTEGRLLDAMAQTTYPYHVYRAYPSGSVPLDTLSLYPVVVWTGGDNNYTSASPAGQQALAQYLSAGGRLLFSAENYLTSHGAAPFTSNYLHVASYETGLNASSVVGVAGDPVTDGFNVSLNFPPDLSATPDRITPDPEATTILYSQPGTRSVALRYPVQGTSTYRVIFMAVPFEALAPGGPAPDNPQTFLQRALDWLLSGTDLAPPSAVTDLVAQAQGTSVVLTWSPSTDNVGVHHYEVHRSSSPYFLPTALSVVATPVNPGWTDAGALGDPTVDHYYLVIAVDQAGNRSAPSDRVGEREFPLQAGR